MERKEKLEILFHQHEAVSGVLKIWIAELNKLLYWMVCKRPANTPCKAAIFGVFLLILYRCRHFVQDSHLSLICTRTVPHKS